MKVGTGRLVKFEVDDLLVCGAAALGGSVVASIIYTAVVSWLTGNTDFIISALLLAYGADVVVAILALLVCIVLQRYQRLTLGLFMATLAVPLIVISLLALRVGAGFPTAAAPLVIGGVAGSVVWLLGSHRTEQE